MPILLPSNLEELHVGFDGGDFLPETFDVLSSEFLQGVLSLQYHQIYSDHQSSLLYIYMQSPE